MKGWMTGLALLLAAMTYAQKKPFSGVFTYKGSVSMPDTNIVLNSWNVTVYTNDTISRVETETPQFGTQVYIRHMELKKAYLLLEYGGEKYAIQTDLGNTKRDSLGADYHITRSRFGGKKVAGIKSKRYYIVDGDQKKGYYCWFAKKIPGKYLEVYPEVDGLATDYYLPSPDGLIHYELTGFVEKPLNRDLFGIPSDYKKITFDEFMNLFAGEEPQE
jgi:hypothetical protein